MKRLKLIYNPYSGDKGFKFDLDSCINKFQSGGYEVHIFRSTNYGDIEKNIKKMHKNFYDAIVVSGGDGTINIVVSSLMKYKLNDIPIGIIPSGTANDFATYLKIPKITDQSCDVILKNKIIPVDIGQIGNRCFINVCAGGLFSNVSQNIDKDFKDILGKLAYYIKGIEQIPNFVPIPIRITNSQEVIEDNIYLFLVLNSSGTGGLANLSPSALINDGLFDFIAFKGVGILEIPSLILKFLKGNYLNDNKVIFFRDNYIKIENLSDDNKLLETDLDGEAGPCMPIEIKNIKHAVKFFC